MTRWQVQEAKANFSKVLERARDEGPQTITRHGTEVGVVMSIEAYRKLEGRRPTLVEYLLAPGPLSDGLDVDRVADPGRGFSFDE